MIAGCFCKANKEKRERETMKKPISPERAEQLKAFGFDEYTTNCDLLTLFNRQVYGKNTKMCVCGDHSEEIAEVIYAELDDLQGFFYAPSLLEYLLTFHREACNVEELLEIFCGFCSCEVSLQFVGGSPMFFVCADETDWKYDLAKLAVSDILKIVGVSDFWLTKKLREVQK